MGGVARSNSIIRIEWDWIRGIEMHDYSSCPSQMDARPMNSNRALGK